jgi:hypothetical protein
MPVPKHLRLVIATIAFGTALRPAGPLFGQGKESEADRIQRGCGPPDIKHGVRISAVGRVDQAIPDKALVHVVPRMWSQRRLQLQVRRLLR